MMLQTTQNKTHVWPRNLVSAIQEVPVQPRAFVLEIGTEELPPRDVVEATEQVNMAFHLYLKNMMTLALQIFLY